MIAENFTEQDEADAIARIEKILEHRAAQHRYVAEAQREVLGRMLNLETIEYDLIHAKSWLNRIQGREPLPSITYAEFMGVLDEHDRLRGRDRW